MTTPDAAPKRVLWLHRPLSRDRVLLFGLLAGLARAGVFVATHESGAARSAWMFIGTTLGTTLFVTLVIRTIAAFVDGVRAR